MRVSFSNFGKYLDIRYLLKSSGKAARRRNKEVGLINNSAPPAEVPLSALPRILNLNNGARHRDQHDAAQV